jgi:hypothetical protein
MQTTLRAAFITDLLLPPPHSLPSLTPSQISTIGYDAAVSILHSPEQFIRSNPLVTDVRAVHSASDSKLYIDVPHWCAMFNLNHAGDPERGISSEWQQFEITDKLSWGLGTSDVVYTTAMRRIPGGFESVTSAGSGVRIYGRFEILRPHELGRLSSNPTNITKADDAARSRPSSSNGHDYSSGAPNTVPGWSDDTSAPTNQPARDSESSAHDTGLIHYIEHNETRCNKVLSVYIKATTAKSHRTMHENFKRRWGEIVKQQLSDEAAARAGPGGSVIGAPGLPRSRGRDEQVGATSGKSGPVGAVDGVRSKEHSRTNSKSRSTLR